MLIGVPLKHRSKLVCFGMFLFNIFCACGIILFLIDCLWKLLESISMLLLAGVFHYAERNLDPVARAVMELTPPNEPRGVIQNRMVQFCEP